jgi:hypothetical protein
MARWLPVMVVAAGLAASASWRGPLLAAEGEHGDAPPADRYEPATFPILGGDSDVGIKLGAFLQLGRYLPDRSPYAFRLQAQLAATFKTEDGEARSPVQDHFLKLDLPPAPGRPVRLSAELNYYRVTNRGYFGLGNASAYDASFAGASERWYEQQIELVGTALGARLPIGEHTAALASFGARHLRVEPYATSKLAEDIALGTAVPLHGVGDSTHVLLGGGVLIDTRDHETVPTRGMFHDFSLRGSPGLIDGGPYYGANLTARFFADIAAPDLTLAVRALVDVLGGDAPLYELARYGSLDGCLEGCLALGGSSGVRGVPAGRYHGRTKALANLELRSFFLPFRMLGERFVLGGVAFFDLGRVWSDTLRSVPALDEGGRAVKWSVGAGPRLRWGDGLVLRVDAAYSPEAGPFGSPIAYYLEAGLPY